MEISIKRISCLSSLGFMIVLAVACASGGCVTVENDVHVDCGDDADDGDTTVVVVVPPDEVGPTDPTPEPTDPQGPTVPMAAPYLSAASLPTNVLTLGTNIAARITVTADAASDVQIRKLSFLVTHPSAVPGDVSNLRLRIVGTGNDLPADRDVAYVANGHCGGGDVSYVCFRVVLDQPLTVAAGTSVTLDVRVDVTGTLSEGDSLTTALALDVSAPQEGTLVGTGLATSIEGGDEDGMLWSNDAAWFYNGHDLPGTRFAHTLVRL